MAGCSRSKKTCPVRIALRTSWGLVILSFSFAVMPGDDDIVILGNSTLKLPSIDVYDCFGACARELAALTAVDAGAYNVDTLQQQTSLAPKEPHETVESLVAHGPNIDMSPGEELRAKSEALEGTVQASAAAGLRDSHVERLCEVIGSRWNAFRRGLRRVNPPARIPWSGWTMLLIGG